MRQPIVFGKYVLLERISVGGMAEVFKAKSFGEHGFEKILAIKRILPSMAEDEEFIQMFIDEAKISGQLSHPNIGQIYELGKIGDSHFIAMEFVWGKDVLQIQNRFRRLRTKMPLTMAAYVASRVCEALDYAHRKRDDNGAEMHIVHRDVSPQNVLVSYAGEVKLIDFGIAKARSRSSKTQAGVLKGKFGYMSPEQVRGLPLDHRSDVFAVGTLLFEMVTGERLFTGESDFATLEKVRNAMVPKPSKVDPRIPPALEATILTALRRDPDERHGSAAELQEELAAFLMTQGTMFTMNTLANSMVKMFEAERRREEEAMQQYLAIRLEDVDTLRGGQQQPRDVAGVVASKGRSVEGDDVIQDEASATQISVPGGLGQAADFATAAARHKAVDEQLVAIASEELVELVELEEDDHGGTFLYSEDSSPGEAQPASRPEVMAAEPTFIFNDQLGQMVQLAEQSTVIFGRHSGDNGGSKLDMPDQGPTVIFDAGLSSAVANSSSFGAAEVSSTMPVVLQPAGSVLKDVLIGVLVALVLVLGIVLWKVFASQSSRAPSPATVVLSVSPHLPAEVIVDGITRGSLDPGVPLTIKDLTPQSHQLLVRSPGLRPVEQRVTLLPGDVKIVNVVFPVPEKSGRLVLKIEPHDAMVFVDGAEISEQAARSPIELRAGSPHEIRVVKEGYRESSQTLQLRAGERLERTVVLKKIQDRAGKPERPAANAGVSSEKAEQEAPKVRKRPAANAEVSSEKAEQEAPKVRKATAVSTSAGGERLTPEPRKASKAAVEDGFLTANTMPWAKVFVDGKDTGKTTPIPERQKIPLRPGRHKVTFVVDGKEFSFPITVSAGQVTKLIRKLPVE